MYCSPEVTIEDFQVPGGEANYITKGKQYTLTEHGDGLFYFNTDMDYNVGTFLEGSSHFGGADWIVLPSETDKARLETLLNDFGVGFEENGAGDINCFDGFEKVDGYNGFFTQFEFDESGKFIKMGAWE